MFPERRPVLKFFFQESKYTKFFSARSNLCNILNIKLLPMKFFLLVDVNYLELSRKPGLNLLKLKPFDKKVLFLADFRSKTNF